MTKAIATAELAANDDAYRIDFLSIGEASPANGAAIALGLGVPVGTVVEALYRAPAVLVEGLSRETGQRMEALLNDLGCSVQLVPVTHTVPEPADMFDVALHIEDVSRYSGIAEALSGFLGCKIEEATRLISTPPGIVLGKVSQATIDALSSRLGEGASLITSNPDAALYDVFLAPCDAVTKSRLISDLRHRGKELHAEEGCILTGLTKIEADALWSAHQRVQELRVVNRDFLRFDLVLTGGALTPTTTKVLCDIAGIPAHVVPRLFDEGEITVMEAVPNTDMTYALEQLTQAGLHIRADLITFLHLGVEITEAPRPHAIAGALTAMGVTASEIDLRRLPYRLPYHMPELQARMVRDALSASGASTELIDTRAGL